MSTATAAAPAPEQTPGAAGNAITRIRDGALALATSVSWPNGDIVPDNWGLRRDFFAVLQVRPSNVFCYVPFIGQVTYSSVAVDARSPLAYMRQTCLEDARPQIGLQEGALHDPISPDPENADG